MGYLYLAVLEDRHQDNMYHVFSSLSAAWSQCQAWIDEYLDRYDFEESTIPGWEYYAWSGEDCPSVHVEKVPLD